MSRSLPLVDLNRDWRLGRPFSAFLERLLALDEVNALYQRHRPGATGAPAFCGRMLEGLGVETHLDPQGLERLAGIQGPVMVLANHPLGGREALLLNVLLGAARPDYRILSNFIIGRVPEVRSKLILVDPFQGAKARQANRRSLRTALAWLRTGGLLGIFPSGAVSTWQSHELRVADGAWAPQTARLARLSGATVVPVHFGGASSPWLQTLARVHPALKTPFLARELMHGPARRIEARVGPALPPASWPKGDDAALASWFRLRCYALAAQP